jgi:single-stranded-DNA-specific exonuclease
MRWFIPEADAGLVDGLSYTQAISRLLARLLVLRGIGVAETASSFLRPCLDQLHDPWLMQDMAAAVERLRRAIDAGEGILIYGDYDVDGTMATVLLLTALKSLGARVEAYIPHRLADGYGMRAAVMEQAASKGCSVVVSVDTGVREHEALARARELGLDCIVTDHHLPGEHLPPAFAILNPRRSDCSYPEKNLTGAGVAFKLVQALLGAKLSEAHLRSYLKLVAMGTIADVAPLTGENRTIVHVGLCGIRRTAQSALPPSSQRPGLWALLSAAGLRGKAVSAADVAFRLAPRLNAAGRMQSAQDVLDLFSTPEPAAARAIAERLDMLNRDRQRQEEEILESIKKELADEASLAGRFALVLQGQGWHRGVIGIVAQRVTELYYRPALVISVEDGIGHGSGRSIPGFHLLDALTHSQTLFNRFGGHAQAAGFSLPAGSISQLTQELERYAGAVLAASELEPALRVDAHLSLDDLSLETFDEIRQLEPFGFGNPVPVFSAKARLMDFRVFKEKHLKIRMRGAVRSFEAIGWGWASRAARLAETKEAEVAFSLAEDDFWGERELRLILKDVRPM